MLLKARPSTLGVNCPSTYKLSDAVFKEPEGTARVTVTVKTTVWPDSDGLAEEAIVVVVGINAAVSVKL